MNEKSGFDSRSYEEYDEIIDSKQNKKIHPNHDMIESTKSMNEKRGFHLRSYEEDIAKLKKMNVKKDEIIDSKQNKKIHPNQ
ncbi:hypothetical protein L195_g023196, partial [Trifolium pratense]